VKSAVRFSDRGFVKIRRGLREHLSRMPAGSLKLYLWLHLVAIWTGRNRGTVQANYPEIAKEFGWSLRQLKRTMAALRPRYVKIVQVGNQHRPTIIRILKYDKRSKRAGDNDGTSSQLGTKMAPAMSPALTVFGPSSPLEPNKTGLNRASKKLLESSRSKAAAAASPKPEYSVWNFLGVGPIGPPSFRVLLDSRWASRNGDRPSVLIGETIDAWETAEGGKLRRAPQLFRALSELRQKEKQAVQSPRETVEPIHVLTPEEIPA